MKTVWQEDQPMLDEVRDKLSDALASYMDEGDKALRKKISWTKLHAFRLESKRFRYTIELFRDLYGKKLEPHIEQLKDIQTYLGDINDCVSTRAHLKGHPVLRKQLKEKAEDLLGKLRKHWKTEFAAKGRKEAWLVTLAAPKLPKKSHSR